MESYLAVRLLTITVARFFDSTSYDAEYVEPTSFSSGPAKSCSQILHRFDPGLGLRQPIVCTRELCFE